MLEEFYFYMCTLYGQVALKETILVNFFFFLGTIDKYLKSVSRRLDVCMYCDRIPPSS